MQSLLLFLAFARFAGVPADTAPPPRAIAGPVLPAVVLTADPITPPIAPAPVADTTAPDSTASRARPRPRAVTYSDAYGTRLAIHRIASYATVPLFVSEFIIGQTLMDNPTTSSRSLRHWHGNIATALGALFTLNTVTGVWNLWDARHDPNDRVRRYLHAGLMLAADAGFTATALMTPHRGFRQFGPSPADNANTHRALALSSMGVALGGYFLMLIWR